MVHSYYTKPCQVGKQMAFALSARLAGMTQKGSTDRWSSAMVFGIAIPIGKLPV
jgi:hypothetical protein